MKASRLAACVGLATLSTAALALPNYVGTFASAYKLGKDSKLAKASCSVCHIGTSAKLNPYGADLKKAMAGSKALSAAALKKVEGLDSDKDGVKNGVEIKHGTLPGDPKSK